MLQEQLDAINNEIRLIQVIKRYLLYHILYINMSKCTFDEGRKAKYRSACRGVGVQGW